MFGRRGSRSAEKSRSDSLVIIRGERSRISTYYESKFFDYLSRYARCHVVIGESGATADG
jgi:hypothetical protein